MAEYGRRGAVSSNGGRGERLGRIVCFEECKQDIGVRMVVVGQQLSHPHSTVFRWGAGA